MKTGRKKGGFTLTEVLVVIAIIGILAAIALPVIAKLKARAHKVQCSSNMKQWGVALTSYAGDNRNHFPNNEDGLDLSWVSKDVSLFFKEYLMENVKKGSGDTAEDTHLLYCPTCQYHQHVQARGGGSHRDLVGYFYLPYRVRNQNYTWVSPKAEQWMFGRKLFNDARFGRNRGPVLTDMFQARGSAGPPVEVGEWGWNSYSTAPHPKSDGTPSGGNFLFEDGGVEWYSFNQIGLAVETYGKGGWICWFDVDR